MDKSSKKRSVSYMRSYHTNITLIQKRPFPPKNMNLGQVPSELKIEEMDKESESVSFVLSSDLERLVFVPLVTLPRIASLTGKK